MKNFTTIYDEHPELIRWELRQKERYYEIDKEAWQYLHNVKYGKFHKVDEQEFHEEKYKRLQSDVEYQDLEKKIRTLRPVKFYSIQTEP